MFDVIKEEPIAFWIGLAVICFYSPMVAVFAYLLAKDAGWKAAN